MRRSRQSELLAPVATEFHPPAEWTRISFLDLLGEGPRSPLYTLEPAYVDGATLVAVWPSNDDYEAVAVLTWAPDTATVTRLHKLQVDWPAALCDLELRQNDVGRVDLRPYADSLARAALRSTSDRARRVRDALDRGARTLGRAVALAA